MNTLSLYSILLVAGGGALGSVCRFLVGFGVHRLLPQALFPWGTFLVNLLGSFAIGFLAGYWIKAPVSLEWKTFLITGFLGGFTTFSAFSLESYQLYQTKPVAMFLYLGFSVFGGLLLAATGFWIAAKVSS